MTVIFGADREPTATTDPAATAATATSATLTTGSGAFSARGLTGRVPVVSPERLLSELVPPARFAGARFDTYLPHPAEPSQAAARDLLAARAAEARNPRKPVGRGLGCCAGPVRR